jgi:hypothetical protein
VVSCVAIGVTVAVLLVVFFMREARSQRRSSSDEGYYAPVYSPDGRYVYFVERHTSGGVTQTRPADLLFTPAQYDVQVAQDRFILKRMHVENGQIEELRRLPPSPTEGQRYEMLGNLFHYAGVRLRFTEDQQLEYQVCLNTHHGSSVNEYVSSGRWITANGGADNADAWKAAACMIQGYNEWPVSGDWELQEVRRLNFFPAAIVAYNHITRDVRVLVKNKDYDQLFPKGVPLQKLVENSVRSGVERDQTVRRVYKELVDKHKATGMLDNQARLRAGKDMQELGYFPKSTTIVARRVSRSEARNLDTEALFKIAKGEMESGIFHDIEQAIARPGEEIDKNFGGYHSHRDYSNSARLNTFLNSAKTRFYVEYVGDTYELTIKRP